MRVVIKAGSPENKSALIGAGVSIVLIDNKGQELDISSACCGLKLQAEPTDVVKLTLELYPSSLEVDAMIMLALRNMEQSELSPSDEGDEGG